MFAAIAVAIAFVLGTLMDKILFMLTVLLLIRGTKIAVRKIRAAISARWAALKHRTRHIFGHTVEIRT